jgi:pyruvate oxidase
MIKRLVVENTIVILAERGFNMEQSRQSVGKLLLDQLHLWGVKRIYGVVGDAILGLMDELAKQTKIEFIAVKHESVAAMMASAEAKLTGDIGVCLATMGPGLGNLINGLGDASSDHVPVLAITGQAPTNKIGTDYKQYINQQELIKPIAGYSTLLAHPDAITEVLVNAMNCSLIKGSVSHVSIPKDIFTMSTNASVRNLPKIVKGKISIEDKDLHEVFSIMETAKQPIILAGLGAKEAIEEINELSKKWGAGILLSLGAKGFFSDNIPHLIGGIGQGGNPYAKELFKQADVVLLVGDNWWPEDYVPKSARIIQIDVAEENIGRSIPVEIGLLGDSKKIVQLLNHAIKVQPNSAWTSDCIDSKENWDKQNEMERNSTGSPIHPARIVKAINQTVQSDAIIAIDTGDVTVWMNRNFKPNNHWMLFSGTWRTMGFGLPAAMSAKLTFPNKQVVAVVGDGGIEMVLADLLTAVKYNLDITVIIFNNHALQMERDKMVVGGYKQEGVELTNPNFVQLATACGWKGLTVNSDSELEKTLQEAISTVGPVLVNVETAAIVHPES